MKLRVGDTVKVMGGKDRGKVGTIERVLVKENRVVVSSVNVYKRHLRGQGKKPGGIVDIVKPLPLSNVALICGRCKKQTRVGYKITNGKKERICKKCEGAIS